MKKWKLSDTASYVADANASPANVIPHFYDENGKSCKISPGLDAQKAANDVAIISLGTCTGSAMTYILKNGTYVDLMYKIHIKRARGNESYIRYYTPDDPDPSYNKIPAKPESLWCVLAMWCRNGGLTVGSRILCGLFGVLAAGFLGTSPITWMGIGVSLLTVLFSFFFSGVMHLFYSHVASTPNFA